MERMDKLNLFQVLGLRLFILIPQLLLEEAFDLITCRIKYTAGIEVWPWRQPSIISLKENRGQKRCQEWDGRKEVHAPPTYNPNAEVLTSAERRGRLIEVTGKGLRRVRNSFSKSENTSPFIDHLVLL